MVVFWKPPIILGAGQYSRSLCQGRVKNES
jgi:hypothetical protein